MNSRNAIRAIMKTACYSTNKKNSREISYACSEAGLTANYVKSVVGHTRFTTTQDRYGNHSGKITRAKTLAKARAIGSIKLIS